MWRQYCGSVLVLLLSACLGVQSQCQMPEGLRGRTMTSNAAGVVTIDDSSVVFHEGLRDCTEKLCEKALTFNCQENQGNKYFFKSDSIADGTGTGSRRLVVYICWYIDQQVSSQKWVYYQGPGEKSTFFNSYVMGRYLPRTRTFNEVCNLTSPLPVKKYNLLLDTAQPTSLSASCPDALLATFNASQTSTSCVTQFDVCSTDTRQTILVSDPTCRADEFFSANGKMDCLHSLSQNGVTYVMTFTPESNNLTLACMAYIEQGGNVYVNLQEDSCDSLVAPTTTTYDVFLEATVLCPFPCTFPTELLGTWVNSRKAREVNVTNTTMTNFFTCSNPPCSADIDSLECYRKENSQYLVRTPVATVDTQSVRVYMCLELTQLSSTKYLYYQLHQNFDPTLDDYAVTFNSGQSVSLSQACDNLTATPYPATRQNIFLKSGYETSSFSTCPDGLLGEFNNPNTTCQSTYVTCDDDSQLSVTGTACSPKPFFSEGGRLGCLHSVTVSGTTYVTLYNTDNNPDGNTTFLFTCVALKANGITLELSQNPLECVDTQTSDNITTTDGALFTYEKTGECHVPCTFPSALLGTWLSSRKAREVTVTSTTITNFFTCSNPPCPSAVDSLECYISDNNQYLLRSPIMKIDGQPVRIYLCLQLTQLSSTKFLYYQRHQNFDTLLKDYAVIFDYNQSVSISDGCDDFSGALDQGTRHNIFVKEGSETSSFSVCPEGLLGEYSNTVSKCQSTYGTCDDDSKLSVTGTACDPKPFFSEGGGLGCLYSVTVSGTTYVTLYNTDASTDENTTFPFTCVALKLSGSTLELSQNPLECVDSQTSNSIPSSDGALFVYTQTGDCTDSSEFDLTIIIIVLIVLLVIIIILIIIICIICRKKRASRRTKDKEEVDAILTKEDDEGGSNLSLDSGYPQSSARGESRIGRGGRGSRGFGTPRSHLAEMYEVAEEKDAKQANVVSHRRRRRRFHPTGKDGERYETDEEGNYSDESWEEYVDEEGNTQVRPKHRRRRRRRRKKIKQTYTRTHVLADGTTVEEEVESEFSVTASSDMTSSEEDRESMTDQIRAQKEKRRTRLQKVMDKPIDPITTVIVIREMDEKAHQPEKKRRTAWDKLRTNARDKQSKTKVHNRGLFQKEAGKAEVPGVTGVAQEVPYLLQYQKKKDIEKILNDEGFFDDPTDKMTAETVFGFHTSDRELSPKPSDFVITVEEAETEERLATATDSSQSSYEKSGLHEGSDDTVSEVFEEPGVTKATTKEKSRHVTIESSPPSGVPSSDSDMKDDGSLGRENSDTSSGVADLSPAHQPSSPEQNHESSARTAGGHIDSRRVSWEKLQGLYVRHRLSLQGGDRDKGHAEGRGSPAKHNQDKRVKTALRRLLNERLFGISDKKKSRKEHDGGDNLTNPDSVANNVNETSSAVGTRGGTRQTGRPVTQGKVAFAIQDPNQNDAKDPLDSRKRNELDPEQADENTTGDEENEKNGQERLHTRGGSRLPPLRTPTMALDRVFTPANYPKWGLYVTASQRTMLSEGLDKDRTHLSRLQAQSARSSKTDDSFILPPGHREHGKGENTTDDESYLDPHRPQTEEKGKENGDGEFWAHKRPPPRSHNSNGTSSISFTKSSGRSPLDLDDRRLRTLLEELYKDKKFMDKLINKIDEDNLEFPHHIAAEDVKFLSEFGRQYLLERAEYWDMHGPLGPPRPPSTALGLRLNRAQTSMPSDGLHQTSSESVEASRPKTVR